MYLTAEELSDDAAVTHNFVVDGCFKRDEDAEGNYYAWYFVKEYERIVDKSPGLTAEIEQLRTEKAALEDDLTNTQLALVQVYEMIGG